MRLVHLAFLRISPSPNTYIDVEIPVLQSIGKIVVMRILVQPFPRNQICHQSLSLILHLLSNRSEHGNGGRRSDQRGGSHGKRRQRGDHGGMQSSHADASHNQRSVSRLHEVVEKRPRLLDRRGTQKRKIRHVQQLAAILPLWFALTVEGTFHDLNERRREGERWIRYPFAQEEWKRHRSDVHTVFLRYL